MKYVYKSNKAYEQTQCIIKDKIKDKYFILFSFTLLTTDNFPKNPIIL